VMLAAAACCGMLVDDHKVSLNLYTRQYMTQQ
jgi:hypothetical protein